MAVKQWNSVSFCVRLMVLLLLLCRKFLLRLNRRIVELDDLFDKDDSVGAVSDVLYAELNMGP